MKFNKKRGFTIVELIIVIAVIAILAAVLIPVFSNLIQQGKDADSKVLVNTLNKGVAMSGRNDYDTMHEVLAVVEQNVGVDVAKLNAAQAKGNTILWDSTNKTFVFLKSDNTYVSAPEVDRVPTDNYNLWKISDNVADLTDENGYSIYWTGENLVNQKVVNGFDAGNSEITSINYERAAGAEAKSVVIRTNGGSLTVNAKTDDIKHYGAADYTNIIAVKDQSFHEFGVSAYVRIVEGHFVAETTAKVVNLNVAASSAKITEESGANVLGYSKSSDDVTVTVNGTEKNVTEVKSEEDVKKAAETSAVVSDGGVAEVNGIQYGTLEAAIQNATNGSTVVLKENVNTEKTLVVTKKLTLDLNGKTIANIVDIWSDDYWSVISVEKDADLTITGNGAILAKEDDCYVIDLQENAHCTIENGTFLGNVSVVYLYGAGSSLTVNGGSFNLKQQAGKTGFDYLLNKLDSERESTTITINGGSFYNWNPAEDVGGDGIVLNGTVEKQESTTAQGNYWYNVK